MTWPGDGVMLGSGQVPAEVDYITVIGADPAAGAEVSVTVPGGVVWQVLTFVVRLTTSAVVANRQPALVIDDGVVIFKARAITGVITASRDSDLGWVPDGDSNSSVVFANGTVTAFDWPPLLAGHRIRTITTNLDAGDNYKAPVLYVAEYRMVDAPGLAVGYPALTQTREG